MVSMRLVAGDHRFQAHRGQGKTEIWVAVVEFETYKESKTWYISQLKIGRTCVHVETPRTPEDLVHSAVTYSNK